MTVDTPYLEPVSPQSSVEGLALSGSPSNTTLDEMDPETAVRKAKMKVIREEFLAREAVFAQYAQEFGTKSRTMRVIDQCNRHEQGGYRCG